MAGNDLAAQQPRTLEQRACLVRDGDDLRVEVAGVEGARRLAGAGGEWPAIAAVALSADGHHLVVAARGLFAVDLRRGGIRRIPLGDRRYDFLTARLSPGAAGAEFAVLDVVDLELRDAGTGTLLQAHRLPLEASTPFTELALSPDGVHLAVASAERAFVVDLRDASAVALPRGAQDLAWRADGALLGAMWWNGSSFAARSAAAVYGADGSERLVVPTTELLGMAVEFDAEGRLLWGNGERLQRVDHDGDELDHARHNIAFCRRLGERLLVTHNHRDLFVRDAATLRVLERVPQEPKILQCATDPRRTRLVARTAAAITVYAPRP